MSDLIDLRSDTVTRPTQEMRRVMSEAPVGDDVFGDDPTVIRLQEYMAELSGKEAALFVSSGTQSNLVALLSHCRRGDEYIVGQMAHTYRWEGGGAAVLGSIQPQPLPQMADGTLDLEQVEAFIKEDDPHFAVTRLLCLENTWFGHVMDPTYPEQAVKVARRNNLAMHLDGARVFNAVVKQGLSLEHVVREFDTVSVCLSKGLGAPVGSVLCGPRDLIKDALRWRKMVGGGMRQAGIIAAAGLFALQHHVNRLADDHYHASLVAEGLGEIDEVKVDPPETNMVYVHLPAGHLAPLKRFFAERGILISNTTPLRLAFHLDVHKAHVQTIIDAFKAYFVG